MILFDRIRENADAIRQIGNRAVEEARRLGVPSHYGDPALGEGIIRETPDGTRQRVELKDGEEIVVETFGPGYGDQFGPLSVEQRRRREDGMRRAIASAAIEGGKVEDHTVALMTRFAAGEIDEDEMIANTLSRYGIR